MENNKTPLLVSISAVVGILIGIFVGMKYQKSGHVHDVASLDGAPMGSCSSEGATANTPLIELDGKSLYKDQLPLEIQNQLYETAHQSYERNSSVLESFALQYMMAKDKGNVDIDNLPSLQELFASGEPTEKELKEFYEQNKTRMPPNTKFADIKPRLVEFLKGQQGRAKMMEELNKLKKRGVFKILMSEPASPLVSIDTREYPSIGPKNAKNIVIEVSDYTCGHCRMVHPQVKQFLKSMPSETKFVQMNFALRPEGTSGRMVKGAYCAQKEGDAKFWDYHNKAFEYEGDKEIDPNTIAQSAGLNMDQFKKCVESNEAREFVNKTNNVLNKAGVTGTPTFFVNNRKLHAHGNIVDALKASLN